MTLASTALKIFWTISLVLLVGGAGLLMANWLKRALKVRADKEHSLKLVNNSNFPSLYQLSFNSVQPGLDFKCLFNMIPLVTVFEQVEEELELQAATLVTPEIGQRSVSAQDKAKPADALKAGKSVAAKSGVAASLLGTLGSLLPGKLGAGLKEKADMARNIQIKTARVTQAPQAVTNKMDALKSTGGRLGVKSSTKESKGQGGGSSTIAAAAPPDNQIVIPVQSHRNVKNNTSALRDTGLVQTRELGSGEALLLTLRIGTTNKRYPTGSFTYTIRSQQIPVDGRFATPAPLSKTGTVYFKPISNWSYLIPSLASSLVLLLALLGIYYGLTYLWG